jgi:transcriptional regulator with XRE-family HTH domain
MPAKPPYTAPKIAEQLIVLGQQIRARRNEMRTSATTAAEAAGMSRVTLYRIEKGEPAVTMGAYLNAMAVLGLDFGLVTPEKSGAAVQPADLDGWIPARVSLVDYAQLKQLAWHVQGATTLSPLEAWEIYERNWRHIDEKLLTMHERQLINALRIAFGGGGRNV